MARPGRSDRALFPPAPAGLRVGLYGGSFNPLHAGHLHVAQTALQRLQLDAIWWLVTPGNPLKGEAGRAAYGQRLTAVRAALAGKPRHHVCTAEAALGIRYSVDLVRVVRALRPAIRPVWIIGADNLANFHFWKEWRALAHTLPIAIIARPEQAMAALFSPMARTFARDRLPAAAAPTLPGRQSPAWVYLPAPLHVQSSTQIRACRVIDNGHGAGRKGMI